MAYLPSVRSKWRLAPPSWSSWLWSSDGRFVVWTPEPLRGSSDHPPPKFQRLTGHGPSVLVIILFRDGDEDDDRFGVHPGDGGFVKDARDFILHRLSAGEPDDFDHRPVGLGEKARGRALHGDPHLGAIE